MAFEEEKAALMHLGMYAEHRRRIRLLCRDGVKWETAFRRVFKEMLPDWKRGDPLPEAPPEPVDAMKALSGRTCAEKASIEWVADNLAFERPDVAGCPSSRAWSMWSWARENETNKGKFWSSIYPLVVPTKDQMEADARREDDGEVDLRLIARVEAERDAAEKAIAERRARVAALGTGTA